MTRLSASKAPASTSRVLTAANWGQPSTAMARSTSRVPRPVSRPKTPTSRMSRAVAPVTRYSMPSARATGSICFRISIASGSTGRSGATESMLDVLLTDPLGDLEIARVERGHEIGVDQQGRYEVPRRTLLRKLRKLPEGVEDLDVSLRIGPQAVLLHERGEGLRRIPWLQVDGGGGRLEMVRQLGRRDLAAPARPVGETCLLPPAGVGSPEPARIELRAQPDRKVGDPFLQKPGGFQDTAIPPLRGSRKITPAFEIEEGPAYRPKPDPGGFRDLSIGRSEQLRFAKQHECSAQSGRRTGAPSARCRWGSGSMRSLAPDEDVESRCPQVCVAGGIDELQVEPVAAMLGELGREVRGDQHPFPAVGHESILDGRQRDRAVDGLDLGEELEAFPAFCDLDHRVRAVALQSLGLPGGNRRSEACHPEQRAKGMVQGLDSTVFLLPRLGHHQPSGCSAISDVHVT